MSDSEDAEREYTNDPEELIEKGIEERQKHEEEHNAMLEAVASGEEWQIEGYEWVEIGEAELKVKTWMPGDVLDGAAEVEELVGAQEPGAVKQALETNLYMLTEQTEVVRSADAEFSERADIQTFFENLYRQYGMKALELAVEAVTEPIDDGQRKEDVVDGFRPT